MVNRVFWDSNDEVRIALLSARQRRLWAAWLRTWADQLDRGTLRLEILAALLEQLLAPRQTLN